MLYDKLKDVSKRVTLARESCSTEEAAKTALVLPLIAALGYDVFDPTEVVPEFEADVGIKKGEKVDYAIVISGSPQLLFECKTIGANLDAHSSQLFRYFSCTIARIGILTDGEEYRFFSDLDQANQMDMTPFFVFNLTALTESDAAALEMFTKTKFEVGVVVGRAASLKNSSTIVGLLKAESGAPSDDFVRFIAGKISSRRCTPKYVDELRPHVGAAMRQFVDTAVNQRLSAALAGSSDESEESADAAQSPVATGIVTTEDELRAFYTIQAALLDVVAPVRVVYRDKKTYFGVLLDNNNRKPICRLVFTDRKREMTTFDAEGKEIRYQLDHIESIFSHKAALTTSVQRFLNEDAAPQISG